MKTYRVRWEIDIEADSPEEAALRALIVQRNRDEANAATVFIVAPAGIAPFGEVQVDLGETTAEQAEEKVRKLSWMGAHDAPLSTGHHGGEAR